MGNLRSLIARNVYNIRGWRTNRKIVVIESDDWGSIRMPSKDIYEKLLKSGISVDKCPYCKNDSLASEDDLSALFDVLKSVKDSNGRNAVITANTIVENPDFEKIRKSEFTEYHYELFPDTLKRYGHTHQNSFKLWQEGISDGIFHPQFHGREHLNTYRWLKYIQQGIGDVVESFDYNMWGLSTTIVKEKRGSFMAAFDIETDTELEGIKSIITDGLNIFENIFSYKSESIIAPNYVWSNKFNTTYKDKGIKTIQGSRFQSYPKVEKANTNGEYHILGQYKDNMTYLVRNCYFEPTENKNYTTASNDCLAQISSAFFWKKPAIISSHRVNYIGSLNESNRLMTLVQLSLLLKQIVNKWPDVEFMTSDELGEIIRNNG